MPEPEFSAEVNALINEMGSTFENSVCTSWILVTEWVDADGNCWLQENRTSEMPPWKRQGILWHILEEPVIEFDVPAPPEPDTPVE